MSLRPFKHINALSLEEAVSELSDKKRKSVVTAGGTDLLGALEYHIHPDYPDRVVNLKTVPDLDYIREDPTGLKIGAMTRLHDIEKSALIKKNYPALAEAARSVASPQIRNMGTLGGNICQETRCWYYRNPENMFHCIRKGGKVCNALTGENRYHSIFGAAAVGAPPCRERCPGHIDIPAYLEKIRAGALDEAARILLASNPIPAITGRVCPHFCEQECNRGEYFDEPVSVRAIERFMGDHILDHIHDFMTPPAAESGKRVAVIGSGPAGLSAAYYLRRSGHEVVILDREKKPGGMLAHAIPAYRLPREVVRRVVQSIKDTGVTFRPGVDVGRDITPDEIRGDFDALFLATGAWAQPVIGLDGEHLTKSGLDVLTRTAEHIDDIAQKKVLVIGGGNVAVDVGMTAGRLGAEKVTLACLESRDEMPALDWEIKQALEEGVHLMTSRGPSRVLESDGKVTGVELLRCTSVFDREGRFSPSFDPAEKEFFEADTVILAVGQKTDLSYIDADSPLKIARGLITIDEKTRETGRPGIFAGGDATSGPATVIEAISAGRLAAASIDRYLGSSLPNPDAGAPEDQTGLRSFNRGCLHHTGRTEVPERPLSERSLEAEDASGLDQKQVEKEADRCFNCGCVAVNPSDTAPVLIALGARIRTTKRTLDAEHFFAAGRMTSTVLDSDELVTEIEIPAPRPGTKQAFQKFRLRKAIDFPVLSVASVFSFEAGRVTEARIVLGAAAPVPLRLENVEAFVKDKAVDAETAEKAAALAIEGAIPLAENAYKVQVAGALVKRAILALGQAS